MGIKSSPILGRVEDAFRSPRFVNGSAAFAALAGLYAAYKMPSLAGLPLRGQT